MATSVESSLAIRLLPTVLSVTAGSADIVSLLAFGLFNAHITGNIVILAAHLVTGSAANLALLLSVPIFILVLALTRLLVAGLEAVGLDSLQPLLLLKFVLLAGFLAFGVAGGTHFDSNVASTIVAGLLGVSAMAVQNALVQISLKGAPATAVMTSNITRFTMDVGEMLLGRDPAGVAAARSRAQTTWPAIVGFTVGAGLGAGCAAVGGRWSLALPAGLALLGMVLGLAPNLGSHRL